MAAIINGLFRLADGAPYVGRVNFVPVNGTMNPEAVVPGYPVSVQTDSGGAFSQAIELGNYAVSPEGLSPFYISVPASGTHSINSRYESGLDWLMVVEGGGSVPIATVLVFGKVLVDQSDPAPVAITKKTLTGADGLGAIFRPVAGKAYIRNSTSGLYHELVVSQVVGVPALGINSVGITFAALPPA